MWGRDDAPRRRTQPGGLPMHYGSAGQYQQAPSDYAFAMDSSTDYYGSKDKSKRKGGFSIRALCCKCSLLILLLSSLFLLVLVWTPWPIRPESYRLPDPPALDGTLAVNKILQSTQRLDFGGQIVGPESIVVIADTIYAGIATGQIAVIKGETLAFLTYGGKPCKSHCTYQEEPIAGRPLGMRRAPNGAIIILDAYLGIYELQPETQTFTNLLSGKTVVEGQQVNFMNDLDVMSDGTILFSDSSTFQRRNFALDILESKPRGRLISFNPLTKDIAVLVHDLHFANGVQLSPDQSFLLISELTRARIIKYSFAEGITTVFADNLPGLPDNIRLSADGQHFWIGMAETRSGRFSGFDFLASKPWLRKLLAVIVYMKPSFDLGQFSKGYGLIVKLDMTGQIVDSYHDPEGRIVSGVSEVTDLGQTLLLGSFKAPFLGKIHVPPNN